MNSVTSAVFSCVSSVNNRDVGTKDDRCDDTSVWKRCHSAVQLLSLPVLARLAAAGSGSTHRPLLALSGFSGSRLLCQPAKKLVPACPPLRSLPDSVQNKL